MLIIYITLLILTFLSGLYLLSYTIYSLFYLSPLSPIPHLTIQPSDPRYIPFYPLTHIP
jgi:hypothetical protein